MSNSYENIRKILDNRVSQSPARKAIEEKKKRLIEQMQQESYKISDIRIINSKLTDLAN